MSMTPNSPSQKKRPFPAAIVTVSGFFTSSVDISFGQALAQPDCVKGGVRLIVGFEKFLMEFGNLSPADKYVWPAAFSSLLTQSLNNSAKVRKTGGQKN